MELFLVEAETGYLKSTDGDSYQFMPPLSSFRAGHTPIDCHGVAEAAAGTNVPAVYYVRLWCRTRTGDSCLVVVRDACSTHYRRLCVQPCFQQAVDCLLRKLREYSFQGLADGLRVQVVRRHTTNGWIPSDQNPNEPATFPWLQMDAAAPRIKSRVLHEDSKGHNLLFNAAAETKALALLSQVTAERSTQVHTQSCQRMGIKPGGWFRLNNATSNRARKPRTAGVAVLSDWLVHAAEADIAGPVDIEELPPLRVLSYDIECYSQGDAFPDPEQEEDAVITIGVHTKTLYTTQGRHQEERVALTLGEAAPIKGCVKCFPTEAALLLAFAAEIQASDADFLAGYNTAQFDNEYLLKRAKLLHERGALTEAQFQQTFAWSRLRGLTCVPGGYGIQSRAYGDNRMHRVQTPGRLDLDMWFERKKANPPELQNLRLNTVAEHYLGDTKLDLPPKQIFAKFRQGSPADLAEIASYCLQDCELVTNLVARLDVLASTLQMAYITGTTTSDILWRGQGIKITTLLLEEAHRQNYLVEDAPQGEPHDDAEEPQRIEGATVLEPVAGMYTDPVLCLDFASLYPSLMRTFTGCVCTHVQDPAAVATETFQVPGTDHHFVTSKVTRGIIPRILDNLTIARQAAKRSMKEATDPQRRALFDSRQLAIKISANSVYGFTGSRRGALAAIPVAESTTAMGRYVIAMAKNYTEQHFEGAVVLYGDTDSIFVRLPPHMRKFSMPQLFQLGEQWARDITEHIAQSVPFHSYIELEFEKALVPLILFKKKRYSGLCYESPEKPPKLLVKGIELVRRDSLPLVKTIQREILSVLLHEQDARGAAALIKNAVETILAIAPGGPYGAVVQSKTVKGNYKNAGSMAHIQVVKNMEARAAGSAPKIGDRVEYVICASSAKRVVDRVEAPEHAAELQLAIDWTHYLDAVERPLLELVQMPLHALLPGSYDELADYIEKARGRARALCAEHSKCRVGATWKDGHMTKDGKVQKKLHFIGHAGALPPPRKKAKRSSAAEVAVGQRSLTAFFKRGVDQAEP